MSGEELAGCVDMVGEEVVAGGGGAEDVVGAAVVAGGGGAEDVGCAAVVVAAGGGVVVVIAAAGGDEDGVAEGGIAMQDCTPTLPTPAVKMLPWTPALVS